MHIYLLEAIHIVLSSTCLLEGLTSKQVVGPDLLTVISDLWIQLKHSFILAVWKRSMAEPLSCTIGQNQDNIFRSDSKAKKIQSFRTYNFQLFHNFKEINMRERESNCTFN